MGWRMLEERPDKQYNQTHSALRRTGAGEGIRTPDRLITNQELYQLSYASLIPNPGGETPNGPNSTVRCQIAQRS